MVLLPATAHSEEYYIESTVLSAEPCTVLAQQSPLEGATITPNDPDNICDEPQDIVFVKFTVVDGEITESFVFLKNRNTEASVLVIATALIGFIVLGGVLFINLLLSYLIFFSGFIVDSGGNPFILYFFLVGGLAVSAFAFRGRDFSKKSINSIYTTLISSLPPALLGSLILYFLFDLDPIHLIAFNLCVVASKLLQQTEPRDLKGYLSEILNSGRFLTLFLIYYSLYEALGLEYRDISLVLSQPAVFEYILTVLAVLGLVVVTPVSFFKIRKQLFRKSRKLG
jgi:hypothetical protein